MSWMWWVTVIILGLIALNVVVFGLLAINDYLERKHRR